MDEFAPFDYVQLATGDLVCLTWSREDTSSWAGVVFYAAREVLGVQPVVLADGIYWKLLAGKDVTALRAYVSKLRGVKVVDDPVGGAMVHVNRADVARHFSGRQYIQSIARHKHLSAILPVIGISVNDIGVSGSTLLGKVDPEDLDLIVYSPALGQQVAQRIRQFIDERSDVWIKGYWGRAHHHRRFRLGQLNVCTKFPLPAVPVQPWLRATLVGGGSFYAVVTAAEWGHCSPALYRVRVLEGSMPFTDGTELAVYSNESAHSMAFSLGDTICINTPGVYSLMEEYIATIPLGDLNAMRPA